MELIRRTIGWTPDNLGVAYFAASFGSAYLIGLATALAAGYYEPWWDFAAAVLLAPLLGSAILGFFMAIGLAIFGVGPTWLLRNSHSAWWMWLVASVWGALAGLLFLVFVPLDSDGGGPMIAPEILALCGATCGLIWWLLARRVLRRDLSISDRFDASEAEEYA